MDRDVMNAAWYRAVRDGVVELHGERDAEGDQLFRLTDHGLAVSRVVATEQGRDWEVLTWAERSSLAVYAQVDV